MNYMQMVQAESLGTISGEKRFLLREEQNCAESKENLVLSGFKGFLLHNDKAELNYR